MNMLIPAHFTGRWAKHELDVYGGVFFDRFGAMVESLYGMR